MRRRARAESTLDVREPTPVFKTKLKYRSENRIVHILYKIWLCVFMDSLYCFYNIYYCHECLVASCDWCTKAKREYSERLLKEVLNNSYTKNEKQCD